jgi:hypothetical protein
MTNPVLAQTRRTLHAVAELVLAGPQYRASGSIRLRVCPGGFRTTTTPDLRVIGTDVVADGQPHAIAGTAAQLGVTVGVAAGEPADVYREGSGVRIDEELLLDADAARQILDAYEIGDAALRMIASGEQPVLWPEHFDVGIRLDDINYGVSPGDRYRGQPYAYVGVDEVPDDPFWNAPFGAARPMTDFAEASDVSRFFTDARDRLQR